MHKFVTFGDEQPVKTKRKYEEEKDPYFTWKRGDTPKTKTMSEKELRRKMIAKGFLKDPKKPVTVENVMIPFFNVPARIGEDEPNRRAFWDREIRRRMNDLEE